MEPIIILGADAPEDQWLAERKHGIGASEAGTIIGLNRYGKGAADIYVDKIDPEVRHSTGLHFEVGHYMEGFMASKLGECFPDIQVLRSQQLLAHPDRRYIRATPDCFLVRGGDMDNAGLYEIKNTFAFDADQVWQCEDDAQELAPGCFLSNTCAPPDDVVVQWQQQAFVTGLKWGYVGVGIGNRKVIFYPMNYDPELFESIVLPKLDDFWLNHVATMTPPALGGTAASKRLVDIMYPASEAYVPDEIEDLADEVVEIDPAEAAIFGWKIDPEHTHVTAEWLLVQRDAVQAEIDRLDGVKALCDNVLKKLLGNRTCALIGRKVNFSITTSMVIDMEKAKKEDMALVTKVEKYKAAAKAAEDLLASKYGSRQPTGRSWKPGKPKKGV